jgi:hypothetical protein
VPLLPLLMQRDRRNSLIGSTLLSGKFGGIQNGLLVASSWFLLEVDTAQHFKPPKTTISFTRESINT